MTRRVYRGNGGTMDYFGLADRRTITFYWAAIAFVILIALIGAITMIYRDYHNRIDSAGQNAMNLASALAEHTTQIFVKLDALSRAVIEDRADPIVGENMLSEVLARRAAAEPAATAIAIVDKSGQIVVSSGPAFPVGKDMSSTDAFKLLNAPGGPQSYISRPYQSKFASIGDWSGWTMNYARKIDGPKGEFDGYILTVVDGPFLYGFYQKLEEQTGRTIGIVGDDGIIRASNVPEVIGRNIKPMIEAEIRNRSGIEIAPSIRTGIERIFAYSGSSVAPLLAFVGIPTAPIYKAWIISSAVVASALLALFAALIALGVILGKYTRSRASLLISTVTSARERQEREFLEAILNTGGALVAVTDHEGRFVVANPAFREIFQIDESIGNNTQHASPLEYALGNELQDIIDKLPYQTNRTVVSRNGQKRELSWTVTAIRSDVGVIRNLVAIGFDITERRAAELAIYQSGKMITLGEMATGIAHEINQPLATITMALDNLRARIKGGKADPDFVDKNLQLVSDQIGRTAAIVSHMRIYGHRSDGSAYPIDPAQAIDGALSIANAQFKDAGITLRKKYQSGEYRILADLTLIEQIILNILLNARDAILEKRSKGQVMANFSDWIEISLHEECQEKMVVVKITDSGPGIDPVILDRLFEPFFTTKPIGSGMGLGLSLSYGMARDLGGRIEAHNTGSGAEFRILLRAASQEEGDVQ